ncbi:hypothetical protein PYCCODRAFT_1370634 [Trametes coccinea BRFM310]|uniref:Uncharacterized protein n=1 Tax=Trametes coccinea (strain BRFM310) TaxID=1353009 RepID=A0A1Y2IHZ6_TRAC3|nr:hypothetical protein PYCCODRAFT_1370634 [Trametes coccinea BRFM310]
MPSDALSLSSAAQIEHAYLRLLHNSNSDPRLPPNGRPPRPPHSEAASDGDEGDQDDEDEEDEDDGDEDDRPSSSGHCSSAASVPSSPTPGPSRSSSPTPIPPSLPPISRPRPRPRALTLAIPPSELNPNFPAHALTHLLYASAPSITHLRLDHAESLLAHDPAIPRALASLTSLTHLSISALGPCACKLVRDLTCALQHAELNFDDAWVASLGSALSSSSSHPSTIVPDLPTGQSSGLPTPAPTPATTPAAPALTAHHLLPDPVSLLAHSMSSLRALRASNALIITVADTVRYPAVRTLALRIAGVPTVTPLVHAFPAVTDLYVYTPYDGCGVRPIVPALASSQSQHGDHSSHSCAPLPSIAAARHANRTSQLYSSFPPLSRLRGFPAGLYALGLTCSVRHLDIGAVAPPLGLSTGAEAETEMVRRVLADTRPLSVSLTFGRGWWLPQARDAGSSHRRRQEREALRAMFDVRETESASAAASGWAGVKELVLRIEEVGRWKDVTRDLAAMLKPLADTLVTLALRWDRTSVPFDRAPPDDDDDAEHEHDVGLDPASPGPASARRSPTLTPALHERTETFARRLADELHALRYVCVEIERDAPRVPPSRTSSGHSQQTSAQAPRTERRFWRVEREGEDGRWLCLDPLDEAKGRKVLDADRLSLEDVVRY